MNKNRKSNRFISLILTLIMLLSISPIYAEADDKIEIPALSYKSTTGKSGNNFSKRDGFMDASNCEFVYEYTMENAGNYTVYFDGYIEKAPMALEVYVNNKFIGDLTGDKKSSRRDSAINVGGFVKGKNTIKVKIKSGTIIFYNIKLEKSDYIVIDYSVSSGSFKNHMLPCKIEAEDFDLSATTSLNSKQVLTQDYRSDSVLPVVNSGNDVVVKMSPGDTAKYTFKVPEAGLYKAVIATETDGKLELYYDGNKGAILTDVLCFTEGDGGTVYLKSGEHTLTLRAHDSMTVDSITFKLTKGDYINLSTLKDGGCIEINLPVEAEDPIYREFYVSPSGDDANDGSKDKPFKTIDCARKAVSKITDKMTGDIIVNILPGRYVITETINFTEADSGKNGYDVVYRGTDKTDKPIIDGGIKIEGWTEGENGIWSAKADVDVMRNLYVNGWPSMRARSKYVYHHSKSYNDPDTEYPADGLIVSKRNFPLITHVEDAEIVKVVEWVSNRHPIDYIEDAGDDWIIHLKQPWYRYLNGPHVNNNTKSSSSPMFHIENAPELLDEQGEFYFDKNTKTVYYYPYDEEDLTTADVYAGKLEVLMSLKGSSKDARVEHIEFDGIEFRHGAWYEPQEKGIASFQADALFPYFDYLADGTKTAISDLLNAKTMHAQIQAQHCDYLDFKNCNFINLGSSAISMDVDAHHSDITGNIFRDISGTAVTVGSGVHYANEVHNEELTSRINISNNVLRRTGIEYHFCPGIGVYYAESVTVSHNDIAYVPYSGVSLGWGWGQQPSVSLKCFNHKVTYNRIDKNGRVCRDGGPIYTLSRMDYTEIAYNYLSNSPDFSGGVYHDTGSAQISTHHNVAENGRSVVFSGKLVTDQYRNYGNTVDSEHATSNWKQALEAPLRSVGDAWPEEARQIMAGAGLEDEYKHLLETVPEPPKWRKEVMQEIRDSLWRDYESDYRIMIDSTDFISNIKGEGYYFRHGGPPVIDPAAMDRQVIGNGNSGDWMKYKVDAKKSGTWHAVLRYALVRGKDANVSSTTGFSLYVDGEKVIDSFVLPTTSSSDWGIYHTLECGEFEMTEGTHIITLEHTEGGFAYDDLELVYGPIENDPNFDDGIFFKLPN